MAKQLSQSQINDIVWKACDSLRGSVDPTEYKDYVLTMLFVKYLSDVWKEKKDVYHAKYNGDVVRIERALKNERFVVPDNCTFDYIYTEAQKPNASVGELIDTALASIEENNRAKLENVFRSVSFNSESKLGETRDRNRRLKNVLADFAELDLMPSHLSGNDVIGDAYEFLIGRFADSAGKKAGEFYTPSEISTLLAKLVDPRSGDRICDPTCGSGSLLIKVTQEIGSKNFSIYGQEVNGATWALCKMNMFLHEFDNADIRWGDTINSPKLLENDSLMKFDVVVANPPFSLDKWGADNAATDKFNRFHRGTPPKSKGDFAFITHMIETTYENIGRVGVIVPHGVLFRGAAEGVIRKRLIEENLLEAVVGLPANLFFGTGIPAAMLIFNKGKKDNTDVLFVDASREYESGKNQNKLRPQDIEKVSQTLREFRAEKPLDTEGGKILIDKYAYRATAKDMVDNDYNLNIPRYVDTFEEETDIDIAQTQTDIDKIRLELAEAEAAMVGFLKELGF
jgi:type I restriction enzyme M protein